jgi:nicotinate-nucleotide pyrophosphorylase
MYLEQQRDQRRATPGLEKGAYSTSLRFEECRIVDTRRDAHLVKVQLEKGVESSGCRDHRQDIREARVGAEGDVEPAVRSNRSVTYRARVDRVISPVL